MKTILIMEDDLEVAQEWRQALEEEGFRTLHACSATEAILMMQELKVDMVITDVFVRVNGVPIPDGGLRLIGAIKQTGFENVSKTIPVIAVTGKPIDFSHAPSVLGISQVLGADRTLYKPITRDQLIGHAQALLA